MNPNVMTNPIKLNKWNLKTADSSNNAFFLDSKIESIEINSNMNRVVAELTELITEPTNTNMRKITIPPNTPQVPWWNETLEKAVKPSEQAFNKYKRHYTQENLLNFKKLRAIKRLAIKN
ncbi:hypothetical protein HHI36_001760, partial [Cryptolaemus montrouzieri]